MLCCVLRTVRVGTCTAVVSHAVRWYKLLYSQIYMSSASMYCRLIDCESHTSYVLVD